MNENCCIINENVKIGCKNDLIRDEDRFTKVTLAFLHSSPYVGLSRPQTVDSASNWLPVFD